MQRAVHVVVVVLASALCRILLHWRTLAAPGTIATPDHRATMSRSVLDKIDWYRTFRPLEIVFYSTCRTGTKKSDVQTFRFHLARRRRMPAPAKSKAAATVKINEIADVKESQPASQG